MATPLRKTNSNSYNHNYRQNNVEYSYTQRYPQRTPIGKVKPKAKKRRKTNPLNLLVQLMFAAMFVMFVSPTYTDNITRPVFLKTNKYPNIKVDTNLLMRPTSAYLNNNHILGTNFLSGTETQKPEMQNLYETFHLSQLENSLKNLATSYPTLKPSVYVWDYESGKHADINSNEVYSAASIIKVPVLINLFKEIENGTIKLSDKVAMTPYYMSEGSGSLQFKGKNAVYTIDELARVMITESDNSATNILMSLTGGMNGMNQSFRKWGMKETRINDWLPDLAGTNVTTAKEMATLIYNLDNPNFMTLNSREKMVDYMGHVHNNRLIQAGLPNEAVFVHKTGDIGKMLGDAGIVFTPNGKKYIVVMLVNRPYNSYLGKEFIVKASSMVYNYMVYVNL